MDALPYHIPNQDDLVICPYNKFHQVAVKRLQYHLMKCRKQHIGQEYVTCPFNAIHEMPKVELRYHITVCPDKARIAADLEYEAIKNGNRVNELKGCTDVPSYEYDFELPEPTEDWDSEILQFPRVGVHPSTLNNPNIIKDTVGLTRAEKKAHHANLFKIAENGGVVPDDPQPVPPSNSERLRQPQTSSLLQNLNQPSQSATSQPAHIFLASKHGLPTAGVGRGMVGVGRGMTRPGQAEDRTAAILAMALGRGRGMMAQAPGLLNTSSTNSSSSSGESHDETVVTDSKREEKKLQKKLRQIQLLEEKQDRGEELLTPELEKISKREEIEMALKCLNLD